MFLLKYASCLTNFLLPDCLTYERSFLSCIKGLIKNGAGQVLVLKVSPREIKNYDGKDYWDLPGGRIEHGSTIEETLRREIKEEIGVSGIEIRRDLGTVLSPFRIPAKGSDLDYGLLLRVYEVLLPENVTIALSDEHVEFLWTSPADAAEKLRSKYPPLFLELIQTSSGF